MLTQTIDLNHLADILEIATITSSTNYAGMLTHTIEHPTIGAATTIQTGGDGALLIIGS